MNEIEFFWFTALDRTTPGSIIRAVLGYSTHHTIVIHQHAHSGIFPAFFDVMRAFTPFVKFSS
jgi:hypothetical protein